MGLPKRLTDMQKRFAEYYVFGDPATGKVCSKAEAAKLAGYSPDRCGREGSELTNPRYSPLVVKYIGELKEERLKNYLGLQLTAKNLFLRFGSKLRLIFLNMLLYLPRYLTSVIIQKLSTIFDVSIRNY